MITRSQIRRQLRSQGGIMNVVGRQKYGLGSFVRKAFGKAKDVVSNVVKSPIGKAALLGTAAYFGGPAIMKGLGSIGPKFATGKNFLTSGLFGTGGGTGQMTSGILGKLGLTQGGGAMGLTGLGKLVGAGGLLGYFTSKGKTPEEAEQLAQDVYRGEGLGLDLIKADIQKYKSGESSESELFAKGYNFLPQKKFIRQGSADGGRIGYQQGAQVDPRMQKSFSENSMRNQIQREMNTAVRGGKFDEFLLNQGGPGQMSGAALKTQFSSLYPSSRKPSTDRQGPFTGTFVAQRDALMDKLTRQRMGQQPSIPSPPTDSLTGMLESEMLPNMENGSMRSLAEQDAIRDKVLAAQQAQEESYYLTDPISGKIYKSQDEAIEDLGIKLYNQRFAKGGRVKLENGTPSPGIGSIKQMSNEEKEMIQQFIEATSQDKGVRYTDPDGNEMTSKEFQDEMSRITELENMTMPKRKPKRAKGGMMNIPMGKPRQNAGGITELDYRASGGFVPVGIKEKADDVPAMLSKNEFVMTADAVRAAGGGSIEKGAQRMYNQMKQLEGKMA